MADHYIWTWWESVTYGWDGWLRNFAPPRWRSPHCDVAERYVNTGIVNSSKAIEWPEDLENLRVNTTPPSPIPYKGSVGGYCTQMVNPNTTEAFTVTNTYGGRVIRDGVETDEYTSGGQKYAIRLPVPFNHGRGVEGYPNIYNGGDMHWIGIEPDGTAHEVIGMNLLLNTVSHYDRYSPDGTLAHGIRPGGTICKGGIQMSAHSWNRGDEMTPHKLGIVFQNLGHARDPNGEVLYGDGTGPEAQRMVPRYGVEYRLSEEAYRRLSETADLEQQGMLDSMRNHGMVPMDRGGNRPHATITMLAGAQWVGSTLGNLDVKVRDLEEVTD